MAKTIIVVETPGNRYFIGPFPTLDEANETGLKQIPVNVEWSCEPVYDDFDALATAVWEATKHLGPTFP